MPAKKKAVKRKIVKKKPAKKKSTVKKPVRGKVKKPVVKKRATKKPAAAKKAKENVIGKVTHYFPHVRAAVIKLKGPLSTGDTVRIKGHTTEFKQRIISLQIDRVPINSAKKGQEIGLLVDSRVRNGDMVYSV
ncbi:MAG: hypothetical protein WC723_04140 [Candidatus Omnitrophota bacterium]